MLRNAGFVVAVALGAVGIWLIVAGNSTQRVEVGVLTGLWGLLLGTICARRAVLAESPLEPPAPAQPHAAAPVEELREQTALAVREVVEVERADVTAARRAFEADLAQLLRQEVRTEVVNAVGTAVTSAVGTAVTSAVDAAVSREVGQLRAEIAQLRQELLEKVGGQLRLERIETTRLIGSDLEAMRAEFRRLKQAEESAAAVTGEVISSSAVIDAQPVPPPSPAPVAPAVVAPDPADPFASLPRLTPFVDDDAPGEMPIAEPDEPDGTGYSGRRRRAEHAESGEDILARLLAREGVHR